MSISTNFYLAYITTKNEEEALTLANSAVEKNLAACGNISVSYTHLRAHET